MCPMQTLHRGLSRHQKRHCSGAFRSHAMTYGLSGALWTLAISLECLKVAILCVELRSLVGTLILDIRRKTRQFPIYQLSRDENPERLTVTHGLRTCPEPRMDAVSPAPLSLGLAPARYPARHSRAEPPHFKSPTPQCACPESETDDCCETYRIGYTARKFGFGGASVPPCRKSKRPMYQGPPGRVSAS